MAQGIDYAIHLWPTCFVSFWAYPFFAIPYFRRRRAVMDLARMVADEPIDTILQAQVVIRALRMQVAAECLAIEATSQREGE